MGIHLHFTPLSLPSLSAEPRAADRAALLVSDGHGWAAIQVPGDILQEDDSKSCDPYGWTAVVEAVRLFDPGDKGFGGRVGGGDSEDRWFRPSDTFMDSSPVVIENRVAHRIALIAIGIYRFLSVSIGIYRYRRNLPTFQLLALDPSSPTAPAPAQDLARSKPEDVQGSVRRHLEALRQQELRRLHEEGRHRMAHAQAREPRQAEAGDQDQGRPLDHGLALKLQGEFRFCDSCQSLIPQRFSGRPHRVRRG